MTAVMKYAGALALQELEADVRRAFDAPPVPPGAAKPATDRNADRAGGSHGSRAAAPLPDTGRGGFGAPYGALLRFAAINLAGFALLAAAWMQGWIATMLAADATRLTFAIFAVFLGGLALCGARLFRIGREIQAGRSGNADPRSRTAAYLAAVAGRDAGAREIAGSVLRMRLTDRIAGVRHVANSLVPLGLIGTVIGFMVALSGIDPAAAGDASAVAPMVSKLLAGISGALWTTLAGVVLYLWLMVNCRLLSSATVRFVAALVERGES
ncbi:MAG: MotA/TolQ/ExbB proton channel family protein [Rhodospirillaceae bacterium]